MKSRLLLAAVLIALPVSIFGAPASKAHIKYSQPIIKDISTLKISIDLKSGSIFVDGQKIKNTACTMKDSIAYVPLRALVNEIYKGKLFYNKQTGFVEIAIEGNEIKYKLGTLQGIKNGESINIEMPLIMEKGTIYCPVKSLASLFDMKMAYNPVEKKITLMAPERYAPEVITAFADFEFDRLAYVQGEKVKVIDQSYDVIDAPIKDRMFLIKESGKTASDFDSLWEELLPGTYQVGMKVKGSNGCWGQWTYRTLMIEENKRPEINEIKTSKDGYAQGEKIDLTYSYINEEWEEIVQEEWSYKRAGDDEKSRLYVKPEYIFCEGDYEVGLRIKDKFGNWSDTYTQNLHITNEVKDKELNFKFNLNQPGIIIDNFEGRNYRSFEQVMLKQVGETVGTNILSDSPENVTKNGILYEDSINGKGRINFHHINTYIGETDNKKIVIMAENTTNEPVTITVTDKIIKGPSLDTLYVGSLLLYQYFLGNGYTYYTLAPGEKIFLINTEDKNWYDQTLMAGQMDLFTNGNVKFTVAAMDKGMKVEHVADLPYLDTDKHPRGTFDITDLYYEVTAQAGKETYFIIGGGSDEWCSGTDGITKESVVNRGNYGVTYHIKIKAEDDIGIILNPRGGAFKGAIRINGTLTYMMPQTGYLTGDGTKAAVIGKVKRGETIDIEYSLPNGSSAPVLFGMIPKKFWK